MAYVLFTNSLIDLHKPTCLCYSALRLPSVHMLKEEIICQEIGNMLTHLCQYCVLCRIYIDRNLPYLI